MRIDPAWLDEVEDESGIQLSSCYQCRKCTNGCPLTFAMDIYPDQVIRLVQMGQQERVLTCSTIWVCSSCETCTTRCPNGVDVAGVMDYLKETSIKMGFDIPQPNTYIFHRVFMDEIRKRGRVFEAGLMKSYMVASGELKRKLEDKSILEDLALGWIMFKKGRMPLFPKGIKGKRDIREILK
ncbi:MAG: 4Fe-4S dicluster domain-containing protein [Thermodesulfobacteriota bacterium]